MRSLSGQVFIVEEGGWRVERGERGRWAQWSAYTWPGWAWSAGGAATPERRHGRDPTQEEDQPRIAVMYRRGQLDYTAANNFIFAHHLATSVARTPIISCNPHLYIYCPFILTKPKKMTKPHWTEYLHQAILTVYPQSHKCNHTNMPKIHLQASSPSTFTCHHAPPPKATNQDQST